MTLVEDFAKVEWEGKKVEARTLTSIIFRLSVRELGVQGDYMISLLDLLRGEDIKTLLPKPGEEFGGDPETKLEAQRFLVVL